MQTGRLAVREMNFPERRSISRSFKHFSFEIISDKGLCIDISDNH